MALQLFAKNQYHVDKALIDPWSCIHSISGLLLGQLNISNDKSIFIAILWELIENSPMGNIIWKSAGWPDYYGDSFFNIISDIFFVTYFAKLGRNMQIYQFYKCIVILFITFKTYNLIIS